MEDDYVIKVEGLHKKFGTSLRRSLAYGAVDLMRNFLSIATNQDKLRKGEFWALEDITFTLKKGESLGIIGVNGSGKSTLLRLLTGIFPPDKGRIEVKGEVGSLIAVGAGFHPHMTGRENIYLNGTILGMSRKEIDEKFDSIINFADIGEFIDAPISTYSSGMRVRLGFAIAIHRNPDILLIDEILSVGDLSFRNKSLRHMAEYREKANALIFVSHDMEQIRNLCSRVIILDRGKIVFDGDTTEGVVRLEEMSRDIRLRTLKSEQSISKVKFAKAFDSEDIDIKDLVLLDEKGNSTEEIKLGAGLEMYIDFEVKNTIQSLTLNVPIVKDDHIDVYCINVFSDMVASFTDIKPGNYRIRLTLEKHNLAPGVYTFGTFTFRDNKTMVTFNKSRTNLVFKVTSDSDTVEKGLVDVKHSWKLEQLNS
jgi:lipopolysaccharide transport system ATP-binding protein